MDNEYIVLLTVSQSDDVEAKVYAELGGRAPYAAKPLYCR